MRLRFLGRSAKQAGDIDTWWRHNRPKAPSVFARELADAILLLKAAPEAGSLYLPKRAEGVRRVLLPVTQYYLYYVWDRAESLIGVLAVWACMRGRPPGLRYAKGRAEHDG